MISRRIFCCRSLSILALFYIFLPIILSAQIPMHSPDENQALLNEPMDVSGDFRNFSNTYYVADSLAAFDPNTGKGELKYRRYEYFTRQAFNNMLGALQPDPHNADDTEALYQKKHHR